MKLHILFFIILFNLGYSQFQNGEVIYRITFIKDTTRQLKSDRIDKLFDDLTKVTNLKQKLTFNNYKSKFELVDKIEDNTTKIAIAMCNCNKIIYTDYEQSLNLYNNSNDTKGLLKKNEFLIVDTLKINWNVTNETKKIDSFLCYKATQKIKIANPKGIFYKTIIAWFAPEIPVHFGPKGYGGLPGLILQLQDKNIIYGCEKINLNNLSENEIVFPVEGKKIGVNEYESILYKRSQERMESIEESRSK